MRKKYLLLVMVALAPFHFEAFSEISVLPQEADQLSASVSVRIEHDKKTDYYTYEYSVSNANSSLQTIDYVVIDISDLGSDVIDYSTPDGWRFGVHADRLYASWVAVEGVPEEYVDDGGVPPSIHAIKPGRELSGFSITTQASPGEGKLYAQGYVPLPSVTNDVEELYAAGYEVQHFSKNSFAITTTVPIGDPVYSGNRRPGVDGFVGLVNIDPKNDVLTSPTNLIVRFSLANEMVYQESFKANLNGIDITDRFVPDSSGKGHLITTLIAGEDAAISGKNILLLSVDGDVPSSQQNARKATDVDRIVFLLD